MRAWLWLSCVLGLLACSDASDPDASSPDASAPDAGEPQTDASFEEGDICASCGPCEQIVPAEDFNHRNEPIEYADVPPTGGDHSACWTTFGVHATEVPDERWVHNLEHGAVVFLHHCPDGCEAERTKLEGLARGRPFSVVVPYAQLPTRFGVVAWGHRLLADCLDEEAFTQFYDAHVNQARESSTSGPPSSCN